jgi:2-polyprenyl-3-methyl-5-hydroxy-6-metoxy-1,4-benzoquinol methylase
MATAIPRGNTYDKYASRNPVERRLVTGFFEALDRALADDAPATVLEVGVGEGEVSSRLQRSFPGAHFVGVDLPDAGLAANWRARDIVGLFGDIGRLPFPPKSFDLVLAIEVLEHVEHPADAVAELARVGRGSFVLSVPREPIWRVANIARGKYLGALGNTPGHIQHWTRRGFTDLARLHLDVVGVWTPFPWTMVAARSRH